MRGLFVILILAVIIIVAAFAFGAGQNTDAVALVREIKHQTAVDQIQEIRQAERQERSPFWFIVPTVLVILGVLSLSKISDIRKIVGYFKQIIRPSGRMHGRYPQQPRPMPPPANMYYTPEPPRQLPAPEPGEEF